MNTGMDLRTWAEKQRAAGVEQTILGDLLVQIYRPKFPDDEIVLNIRNTISGGEVELTFVEHFATKVSCRTFWVYVNKEEDKQLYQSIHEEINLSDPLENLKKIFPDGRFDYIVDNLLAYDSKCASKTEPCGLAGRRPSKATPD